jgi:hypothetical protein
MVERKMTKTDIKGILNESVFDPKSHTPFAIAMDDPNYAEIKAQELIQEARIAYKEGSLKTYHDKIAQAIASLAFARAKRGKIPS